MATFLVMTPDGRRDAAALADAALVRDDARLLGAVLTPFALAAHRGFVPLVAVTTLITLAVVLCLREGTSLIGLVLLVATLAAMALEGGSLVASAREAQGFRTIAVLAAPRRADAEAALPSLASDDGRQPAVPDVRIRLVPEAHPGADAFLFAGGR